MKQFNFRTVLLSSLFLFASACSSKQSMMTNSEPAIAPSQEIADSAPVAPANEAAIAQNSSTMDSAPSNLGASSSGRGK